MTANIKNAGAVTLLLLIASIRFATGQNIKKNYEITIEQAISSWNKAFNNPDSLTYYALFDSASIVISGEADGLALKAVKTFTEIYIN